MILGTVGEALWLGFLIVIAATAYAGHVIYEAWKARHA